MRKIGIFGGTFDPIHFGHIHLALSLKESEGLDEVVFSPNFISPFKQQERQQALSQDRLNMVRLAIEGIPGFSVTDFEARRAGPSYTIDLIHHVQSLFEQTDRLFLLLGEDLLEGLLLWKDLKELLSLAQPLVGCRDFCKERHVLFPELRRIALPVMEISSTLIRERLWRHLYVEHLVPKKVLDYIYQNKLYFHY